ncbi:MAG: tRNA pseudouridine(13) synthase TruD [Promethearchaeota archaeon]
MHENEDISISFQNIEREIEKFVEIKFFNTSEIQGIKGIYKYDYKDFIVKEIPVSGEILEIREDFTEHFFPEDDNDKYTTFNLIKVNKDTFEAMDLICNQLKISPSLIFYSGLKDKLAITVQKMSIKGNYIDQLKRIRIRDLFIRNIHPTKKPVKLGSHWGNFFVITIRKIPNRENLKKDIEHLFKKLTTYGFPNYYGLQRFGTFRPNSHVVGRYLIERKYEKAFNEFVLSTYPPESNKSKKARTYLKETGDYKAALSLFPKSLQYERKILAYMIEHPEDYKGAFEVLPTDLKRLIISSYQSYLFNKMLSRRHEKSISFFIPQNGDVIAILEQANGTPTLIKYIFGSHYDEGLLKALERDRAAIVCPIIGYGINLENFPLMNQIFQEICKEEQINPDIFYDELFIKLDLKGTIRSLLVKPIGLNLLEFEEDEFHPNYKKLKFEFSLPKGCYATMLLREIIK